MAEEDEAAETTLAKLVQLNKLKPAALQMKSREAAEAEIEATRTVLVSDMGVTVAAKEAAVDVDDSRSSARISLFYLL